MLPLHSRFSALPAAQGLYHPDSEVDSCGVAMIATLQGRPGHHIVEHALTALRNLEHRGAVGAEEDTGDGTGITVQLPDAFLREVSGLDLPARGGYAAGTLFVPRDMAGRTAVLEALGQIAADEGLVLLGTREVPVTEGLVGPSAEAVRPDMVQVFLSDLEEERTGLALEPAQVPALMEAGKITLLCERGTGQDHGCHRVTFYHARRRFRILIDPSGRIFEDA